MKTAIVSYSRSGNTATVAHALASRLHADLVEISCPRYRPGWLRYLMAGYDSVKGNLPEIDLARRLFDPYDLVILGAPIWTSYPALPLRTFLTEMHTLPPRVALVLTHGGHSEPKKAVAMVRGLLDGDLEATLFLQEDEVSGPGFRTRIDAFAEELERGSPASAAVEMETAAAAGR